MCGFGKRKLPACIVLILSFFALVAGCLMVFFSFQLNGSEFMDKFGELEDVKELNFDSMRNLIFYCLIIFSFVAIVAACMGCGAYKIKNRCYTVCYGCVLLPTWIVIFVVGIIAVGLSQTG